MHTEAKCALFSYYLHTIFTLVLQLSASFIFMAKVFLFNLTRSSPDARHETRKTLNSVIYRMRKEKEWEMMVAMRLGFIEIELSQQNFVPPIGNFFCASESQCVCVHGEKSLSFFLFRLYFLNQCRSSAAIINIWCENFPFRRLISHSNSFSTLHKEWVGGRRKRKVVELFKERKKPKLVT